MAAPGAVVAVTSTSKAVSLPEITCVAVRDIVFDVDRYCNRSIGLRFRLHDLILT